MNKTLALHSGVFFAIALAAPRAGVAAEPAAAPVQFRRDDDKGLLRVMVEGKEAIVYQYNSRLDLPHYWPIRSPSGKSMTVQYPRKYPHHRSFWFGDTVKPAGSKRSVSTYNAFYSKKGRKPAPKEFPDRVRHVKFAQSVPSAGIGRRGGGEITTHLVWEMDFKTPILDETRNMRVVSLGGGQYLLDITVTVTATYGDVQFISDWVHYAWPYLRMNETFNVEKGRGTITSSEGGVNQKGTNGRTAKWVDYSAAPGGKAEGLAIFSHPSNARPHKWLTRDYGCFGPRRIDTRSGKKFTLKKGRSLRRRVGILVHGGDVKTGKVARRYRRYAKGGKCSRDDGARPYTTAGPLKSVSRPVMLRLPPGTRRH